MKRTIDERIWDKIEYIMEGCGQDLSEDGKFFYQLSICMLVLPVFFGITVGIMYLINNY